MTNNVITKLPVERNDKGFWKHPSLPNFNESTDSSAIYQWFSEHNLELYFTMMDDDADQEFIDRWYDEGLDDCSPWEPTQPSEDSILLAIYDTEDGPCAWFGKPKQESNMEVVVKFTTDGKLIVEIPAEYLENAFEMGVTTNCFGKVTNREAMLQYFAHEFANSDNDSKFGRFIDDICAEAIENGEHFVTEDDDE